MNTTKTMYLLSMGLFQQEERMNVIGSLSGKLCVCHAVKVVEHPDIFVQNTEYSLDDFDYIIELRHDPDEEITYEVVEKNHLFSESDFGGFDF